MSFFSFNENFYRRKLEYYENRSLSNADIYEAKQLLKVLDDLTDEGYTNLGKFYVNLSSDEAVKEQSFAEMKVFMRQQT